MYQYEWGRPVIVYPNPNSYAEPVRIRRGNIGSARMPVGDNRRWAVLVLDVDSGACEYTPTLVDHRPHITTIPRIYRPMNDIYPGNLGSSTRVDSVLAHTAENFRYHYPPETSCRTQCTPNSSKRPDTQTERTRKRRTNSRTSSNDPCRKRNISRRCKCTRRMPFDSAASGKWRRDVRE